MTRQKLEEVLKKHKMWLNNEAGGERANLSCANLRRADLSDADLSDADLSCAKGLLSTINFLEAHFERCED